MLVITSKDMGKSATLHQGSDKITNIETLGNKL